jgi:hypothetical protein
LQEKGNVPEKSTGEYDQDEQEPIPFCTSLCRKKEKQSLKSFTDAFSRIVLFAFLLSG